MTMMRRINAGLLVTALACNSNAVASAPEPAEDLAESGGSGGEEIEAADEHGSAAPDSGARTPAELAAAAEEIDAAIAAARSRHEEDRLVVERERHEFEALKAELETRLRTVDDLEGRIDRMLGAGKIAADRKRERTDVLANLIATMPPAAAATMLAQMSDTEAQSLLFSVALADKRKAAKLIAGLPPARAAAIGTRYLERDPAALEPARNDLPPAAPVAPPPLPTPPAPTPTSPTPSAPAAETPASDEPTAPTEPTP